MALRPVELAGRPRVEPAAQPAPHLFWASIADLVIDDDYQRPLQVNNWKAIERIAENFSWSRFSPVLVAPLPGGRYAVVDGQHRAHAALMCGFDSVPAMVVPMSPQEQAGAFTWVNGQVTRVTAHQVYKAALAAGEGWAVRCDEVVSAADCRLMTANWSHKDKKARMVFCLGLVRTLVQGGHAWAVTAGLRAIVAYDTAGKADLYSDFILNPWLRALSTDPSFARMDLAGFLRAHSPYLVIQRADRELGGAKGAASAPDRAKVFVQMLKAFRARQVAA